MADTDPGRQLDEPGRGGRRALQVTLGTLAAIPFASGLAGMLVGPAALPQDDSRVQASLDSEYRFAHAFWFATAPVIWAQLPRIEQESPALRAALGTVFAGGFARVLAWRRTGRPHPAFVAALALELVAVPALAAWQNHVVKQHRTGTVAGGSGRQEPGRRSGNQ
ncbi:MAG TPA: DUF4345 domain-containing protein [Micromonosporaceae bacterium]|nr:DUF4345 domain-containing protein [Micromonosporaceae bacterium]